MNFTKTIVTTGITAGLLAGSLMAASWNYENVDKWGELSKDFEACKLGQQQSPFDIVSKDAKKGAKNELGAFAYTNESKNVVNNGHSIQVNFEKGGELTFGGKAYKLIQVHFHTPSEFTIDGKHYPMVAHIVHATDKGEILVVAKFFDEGAPNPTIAQIWDKMPQKAGDSAELSKVDLSALVSAKPKYYAFKGSLTTPPCSESVQWIVLREPTTASREQMEAFTKIIGKNNRPLQPANKRLVEEF